MIHFYNIKKAIPIRILFKVPKLQNENLNGKTSGFEITLDTSSAKQRGIKTKWDFGEHRRVQIQLV